MSAFDYCHTVFILLHLADFKALTGDKYAQAAAVPYKVQVALHFTIKIMAFARACSDDNIYSETSPSGPENYLHQQQATESSPLDRKGNSQTKVGVNYWTFCTNEISHSTSKRIWNGIELHGVCPIFRPHLGLVILSNSSSKLPLQNSRGKLLATIAFVLIVSFSLQGCYRKSSSNNNKVILDYAELSSAFVEQAQQAGSELLWDHNVYYQARLSDARGPYYSVTFTNSGGQNFAPTSVRRNLLIAQMVGGSCRSIRTPHGPDSTLSLLNQFASITSRPNRAYARQWGRNYVRVLPWRGDSLDSASFLKAIFDRQQDQQKTEQLSVPYDVVALLPPGTIIMDLDYDLLELISPDKILAIAGGDDESLNNETRRRNGVLLFNLNHKLANIVISRWCDELEYAQQQQRHKAGFCNFDDLSLLVRVIQSIVDESVGLQSVVHTLDEAKGGFILESPDSDTDITANGAGDIASPASYCIKSFAKAVIIWSSSLSSAYLPLSVQLLSIPEVTRASLQAASDSVCYRYYPKCEIL